VPFALGGVQVTFNGQPAPLLYGSTGQINAVVPFEVAGQSNVQMAIIEASGQVMTATLPMAASNPSIFSANASGIGQGAILNNPGLTRNSASNPASPGSVVSIYATGAGVTKPASVDGVLTATVNPPKVAQPVTVTIGGQIADVLYQGAAPGMVAGISQINVRIPANVSAGPSVPVTIAVGDTQSQGAVTIAIK